VKYHFKFQTISYLALILMLIILFLVALVHYWQGGRVLILQHEMRDFSYKLLNDSHEFNQSMHDANAMMSRYRDQSDDEAVMVELGLSAIQNLVQTSYHKGGLKQEDRKIINHHVSHMGDLVQLYINEEYQQPSGEDALQLRLALEENLAQLQILILNLSGQNIATTKHQILDLLQDIDSALFEYAEKERITVDRVEVLLSEVELSLNKIKAFLKHELTHLHGREFYKNEINSFFSKYSEQVHQYIAMARIILHAREENENTIDDIHNINEVFNSQWQDLNSLAEQLHKKLENRLEVEINGTISFLQYSQNISLIAAIIGLILVVVAMIILNRILAKRLTILIKGAVQFAHGCLDKKIILNSGDGFADLATQLNLMSNEIASREKALQDLNDTLEQRIDERTVDLVTARDEAESANLAKSEFLSRMSHELRTPMNAILGFGQLLELEAQGFNETQRSNVKEILDAGHHLLDLINEVLDLARIESGKLEIFMEKVSVDEVMQQSVTLIQPLAAARQIELIDHVSGKGYIVHADTTRLKQVLVNLLSNAVKYNREHGNIIVSSEIVDKQIIHIQVIDSGDGLSEKEIAKLFSPFERLNAIKNVEGTGIGLVISKHLVELMGGTIGIESTPGKGSRFWVELKLSNDA